jgi:hypothetical protein
MGAANRSIKLPVSRFDGAKSARLLRKERRSALFRCIVQLCDAKLTRGTSCFEQGG